MKPLVTNQCVMHLLCMLPFDEATGLGKKIKCVALSALAFMVNFSGLIASVAFIQKFNATDLEGSLYALFHMFILFIMTYSICVAFFLRHRMDDFFRMLTQIYYTYANEDSFRYLVRANKNSEILWGFYIKFSFGAPMSFPLIAIGSIFFCWLTNGKFYASNFYRPCKMILPWNQDTLLGYMGEICFDIIICDAFFISNGALLLLFVSICLHHQAFYKMFRHSLKKLENPDKNRKDKEFLFNLVSFHVSIKDLFFDSAKVFSPFLMIQLICNTMSLASVIFQIDMKFKHPDFCLMILLAAGAFILMNLFLYCYLGKMATESYAEMAECVYEANWQDFPINWQKSFVLMIGNAQGPLFYHGFGMINLNLGTFCKLLKAVYTYYMMFKTLTSE